MCILVALDCLPVVNNAHFRVVDVVTFTNVQTEDSTIMSYLIGVAQQVNIMLTDFSSK